MSVTWVVHVTNNAATLKVVTTAVVILDMNWSTISFVMVSECHYSLYSMYIRILLRILLVGYLHFEHWCCCIMKTTNTVYCLPKQISMNAQYHHVIKDVPTIQELMHVLAILDMN